MSDKKFTTDENLKNSENRSGSFGMGTNGASRSYQRYQVLQCERFPESNED